MGNKGAADSVKSKVRQKDRAEGAAQDDVLLIKKYPNRRLYNTATSKYIKLDDVVALVKEGVEFRIEEAKSGEDITRPILNQIIFEQEIKPQEFLFPLEFQKQLIALYGNSYGSVVPNYLTEAMTLFSKERKAIGSSLTDVVSQNTKAVMDVSTALAKQNMDLWKRSMGLFGLKVPDFGRSVDEARSKDEERADIEKQIAQLQRRLEELK